MKKSSVSYRLPSTVKGFYCIYFLESLIKSITTIPIINTWLTLLFNAPEKVFYLKFVCGVKKAALVAMT